MTNPFDPGYFETEALRAMGFRSVGENVRIARNCTIIGLPNIEIGSDVRIDGYTTISAGGNGSLRIGSHVHVAGYGLLIAGEGIEIGDFANLSQGVRLYTRSDDYSGEAMTNPTVPEEFTRVTRGSVRLGRHVILGSGTVVLPGADLGEGAAVGALSLVRSSLEPWGVYAGIPARRLRERSRRLLELEAKLREAKGA